MNSRGEIILLTEDKITVIKSTGCTQQVVIPGHPTEFEITLRESEVCSLAVDCSDNVHIVRWLKLGNENGNGREDFVLYTFDQDYKINHSSVLDFIDAGEGREIDIAVHEKKSLTMITNSDKVYVCDNKGNMKVTFEQDEGWLLMNTSISHNNEILTVSDNRRVVKIHSSDGSVDRLKTFAEGHKVKHVAFHPSTSRRITVLVYNEEGKFWCSYHYSETSDYEARVRWYGTFQLPCLPLKDAEKYWWEKYVHSLPSTAVAVPVGQNIVFIFCLEQNRLTESNFNEFMKERSIVSQRSSTYDCIYIVAYIRCYIIYIVLATIQ